MKHHGIITKSIDRLYRYLHKKEAEYLRYLAKFKGLFVTACRWAWYGSAILLVLIALLFTVVRIFLPVIAEKKGDIESYLSKKSGYQVKIQKIDSYWDGMHPGLRVRGIKVYTKKSSRPAAEFNELRASLVLLPMAWGQIEIHRLILVKPKLAFERLKNGRYRIRGFEAIRKENKETKKELKISTPRPADDSGFVAWLFGQGLLAIEGGDIVWRDYMGNEPPLHISNLNLSLRNKGNNHQIAFNADFPKKICGTCSVVIAITGNPLVDEKGWDGQAYLQAEKLNLGKLPLVLRQKIPSKLVGIFDVELWSDWKNGRPREIEGNISIDRLSIPVKGIKVPVKINEVDTRVRLVKPNRYWRVVFDDLVVRFGKKPWYANKLLVSHQPEVDTIRLDHIDLDVLTEFLATITIRKKSKALNIIRHLQPGGRVNNVVVTIEGALSAPKDFNLTADLAGIRVRPYKKFPGLWGLVGKLHMSKHAGKFLLNTGRGRLELPKIFRKPAWVKSAKGYVEWKRKGENWFIKARRIRIIGDDAIGEGRVDMRVPVDRSISPWVKVYAKYSDGNVANAHRYFPINVLTKKALAWMDSSIISGTVTNGYVYYNGATRKFPRTPEDGDFKTSLHVKNAVFRYLPGWPELKNADVDLHFKRSSMLATVTRGDVGGLNTHMLVAQSDDIGKKSTKPVNISVQVRGHVNEAIKVLRSSLHKTANQWRHLLAPGLSADGSGVLNLRLQVWPKQRKTHKLTGNYKILGSDINLPVSDAVIMDTRGSIAFNESGLRAGIIQGRFLNGPAVLKISQRYSKKKRYTEFDAQGKLTGHGLQHAFGQWLAPYVVGTANWDGNLVYTNKRMFVNIRIDPGDLKLTYPAPLSRPKGVKGPLIIRTGKSTTNRQLITISLKNKKMGLLNFVKGRKGWDFNRGMIALGKRKVYLPKTGGLHIAAYTNDLNADPWIEVLRKKHVGEGIPDFITHLSGRFKSLTMFDRVFGKTHIKLDRKTRNIWSGRIHGNKATGAVSVITRNGDNRFNLDLSRLIIPDPKSTITDEITNPRKLPYINLRAKSLNLWQKEFGRLSFLAGPIKNGWRIYHLNLSGPVMDLRSYGYWYYERGKHLTEANVRVDAKDIGKTLDMFGTSGYIKGGKADIDAKLIWTGIPLNVHYPSLAGNVNIKANSGTFLQVSEGAGRLLRVFDITSVFGYLIGDFRPIFGKGFAFKKLDGQLKIRRGNADTELNIKGKSAYMGLRGYINIAKETYDLRMAVIPRLTGSLTVLGWQLWNPAAAVWIWITQKIFRKQIRKGTTTIYNITGTWDKPVVKKVGKIKATEKGNKDKSENEVE